MKDTVEVLGFPVTTLPKDACLQQISRWIDAGDRGRCLVCANPHSLVVARRDPLFGEAILRADLVVPDGIGVVLATRLSGAGLGERITGSDIFLGLSRTLDKRGGSVFFLGSTGENLARIVVRLQVDFPGVTVAGSYAPPFKAEFSDADNEAMVAAVNSARPDVLWVGMTAPKQEKWIQQHRHLLDVRFIAAIGAVFDFYTGRVQRSHPLFQRLGLEWLPRLLQEPRRLWRRNLVSNPLFVLQVLKERLSSPMKPSP